MNFFRASALLLLAASLAGTVASAQENPANPLKPDSRRALLYTIAITDSLRVSVFGEEDLSRVSRVDAKGMINLPLIGEVRVFGLTLRDAEQAIADAYREGRFLRNPQVTINVEVYAIREISVQGQVKLPGRISLPAESTMSVLEAVTKSGGFTDTAKGTEVRVTRIGADGKVKTFVVDVDSLIKGKNKAKSEDDSLLLLPGDIIYVPEKII
ncbi:MAG: Polysaccharide biosynthesis/export protein [Verrucomicrobia bacterium]|nr:Polysaccharide biosynthesis/export protein [Verrucomicrobiota bacterium]